MSILTAQAQDSVVVRIFTLDKTTQEEAPNVKMVVLYDKVEALRCSSGPKGEVSIQMPIGVNAEIRMSHPRFQDQTRKFKVKGEDTVDVKYSLIPIAVKEEKETVVYAPGHPEEVFGSPDFHIEDFELMQNGELLFLTYEKNMNRGSELKLYNGQIVTSTFDVPGEASELIHDFRGNPHVVCRDNVFGIHKSDGQVGISTIEKEYYMTYVAPIVDTNSTKMYFSNFTDIYPAFEYFAFDQWDSTYRQIVGIEDELMMELYLSEYKWVDIRTKLWAKNKEIQTGIQAEVWVGANYFTQSIYYKEAYSPMFHRNDTLFVLDYYKDLLFSFDRSGNKLDSVAIYHHYNPKKNGWKRNVIQDRVTGQIFAVFEKGGYSYVGLIDTEDGEIHQKVRLEHRYIEKIQIQGNKVYYIYRPFESLQKKYLYREGLPYEFKGAKVDFASEDD